MNKMQSQLGKLPELKWVHVDQIDVDRNYQREIKPRLVKTILKKFCWDHFGAVVLSLQDDGRFHVTDGQHRVKAAKLHPDITDVPALIISSSGLASEAANFLAINQDRQAVNSIDRYWAGITAGDAACQRLARVLEGAGCDVVPRQGDKGNNLTHAVTGLQRSIKMHGESAVGGALMTIREAWPNKVDVLRGVLIASLARLIRNNPQLDQDRVVELLQARRFSSLTSDAEVMRKLSGGTAETNLSRTIAAFYNKGHVKKLHISVEGTK